MDPWETCLLFPHQVMSRNLQQPARVYGSFMEGVPTPLASSLLNEHLTKKTASLYSRDLLPSAACIPHLDDFQPPDFEESCSESYGPDQVPLTCPFNVQCIQCQPTANLFPLYRDDIVYSHGHVTD